MSNLNTQNNIDNKKQKSLEILSGNEFITKLKEYNLDVFKHNNLFIAHILAIAYETSNIVSGQINVHYSHGNYNFNDKKILPKPTIEFEFETYTGEIISNNLNNKISSIKLINKNYNCTSYPEFRQLLLSKEKYMRQLDATELILFNQNHLDMLPEFILSFNHKNNFSKASKLDAVYEQIILQNEEVNKFIQFYNLSKKFNVTDYIPEVKKRRKI